jgi:catechol 2,3-dioxygenase-like lactoylglutathione lyase family enzyme
VSEPRVVYLVHDFDLGRDFYKRVLGFEETFVDFDQRLATLERGTMRIAITQGDPNPAGGVAMVDVDDVKAEAERLRGEKVEVGTVVEVFDPDGNRIQLAQPL